jgi:hypothetical protein
MENNDMKIDTKELIILLLGVVDRPITIFHLQYELFVLNETKVDLNIINEYVETIDNNSNNNNNNNNNYNYSNTNYTNNNKIRLNEKGKTYYDEIHNKYSSSSNKHEKFKILLVVMKLIRNLYDKLTVEELAVLLYEDITEASALVDGLNHKYKYKVIEGLYKKGYITEKRYRELLSKFFT